MHLSNINLENAVHADGLNGSLLCVDHICDTGKIFVFIKSEAVILGATKFSANEEDIEAVAKRSSKTQLYDMDLRSHFTAY